MIMEEQDKKDQKMMKAKEENKKKYTVSNNFTPRVKKPNQVKKGQGPKKQRMFRDADDEVNQYMKELGLI